MIRKIYKSAAKAISASRYGTAVIGGKKLSATKLKQHIIDKLQSGAISGKKLEKVLAKEGLNKMQIAKRKRLIKTLTGTDVEKLTPKELRKQELRVKMRIAAARQSDAMNQEKVDRRTATKKEIREEARGRVKEGGPGGNSMGPGPGTGNGPAPSTGGGVPPIGFNKMM